LDWQFWQRHDLAFLAFCDEMVVLKLPGWEESIGVRAEIAAARTLGKPVTFLEPIEDVQRDGEESKREETSGPPESATI